MSNLTKTNAVDSVGPANADNSDLTTALELGVESSVGMEFISDDVLGAKLPPLAGDVLPPCPTRPQIRIADGEQPEILRTAERVVAQQLKCYSRGGDIVRITSARDLPESMKLSDDPARDRPADQRVILECPATYLATEITEHADVTRLDSRTRQVRKTDFPERLATALKDRKEWPNIKPLDAILRAPFVRADGSICDQPGYDPASRCYADFDPSLFYELPSDVSKDEALDALATLRAPFDEIPFSTPESESAFIALILSETARIATDCTPITWVSAADPGTGKTMVSHIPSLIVHGKKSGTRPWPKSPDELRKVLFSALLAGDQEIVFDNIGEGVKINSAEMGAFVTSTVWKDRKLGESGSMELPNRATIIMTGNNIDAMGDLVRRSLVIRLNANMDRDALAKRTFKINGLEGYVQRHRVELLMSALTIIKAHQQSGHVGPTALASFERWSSLVRDALIWLGMPDPCVTQRQETDDGRVSLAEAFAALAPKLEGRKFTSSDVRGITLFDNDVAEAVHDSGCSDPRDTVKIGYWLRANRDRFGGDFRLTLGDGYANTKKSKKYQFVRVRTALVEDTPAHFDLIGGASC